MPRVALNARLANCGAAPRQSMVSSSPFTVIAHGYFSRTFSRKVESEKKFTRNVPSGSSAIRRRASASMSSSDLRSEAMNASRPTSSTRATSRSLIRCAGVELDLQVLVLQLRLAHRVLQEGQQVTPDLALLDDLERAHPDAVVVRGFGARRHPAGLLGAVLPLVDDRRDPGDQLALVEHRQDHALVGVVDVAVAGVVVDEGVAVVHPDARVADPVLVDEPHRVVQYRGERQHPAGADMDQVAGGRVDARWSGRPISLRARRRSASIISNASSRPATIRLRTRSRSFGVDRAGQQPLLLRGPRAPSGGRS